MTNAPSQFPGQSNPEQPVKGDYDEGGRPLVGREDPAQPDPEVAQEQQRRQGKPEGQE